jgi:phosphoribosylglycinamide formyltransferase 1
MKLPDQRHIAIFASGKGSNAAAIIAHLKHRPDIKVALILTNKKDAGVIEVARTHGIPYDILSPKELKEEQEVLDMLEVYEIDMIVLAGYLLLIPPFIIAAYPRRVINIHPALLPLYGGRGMYGAHVHEAVLAAGDVETGITIHYVDSRYDEGEVILQARCPVLAGDTIDTLATRVHALEHEHYPVVVERLADELEAAGE